MTFRIIRRGSPRPVRLDFCCPRGHGHFTALVDPDAGGACCPRRDEDGEICNEPSPWSPRTAPVMRMRRVEATRGKSEAPEHRGWLDTSNLEEGQPFEEWQADREAVHEELRKELVMEMVKTDR